MSNGKLISIHIGAQAGETMQSLNEVQAVAGRGLDGDRYFLEVGTYSKKVCPDRQVTLMECEVIETLKRDYDIDLSNQQSRRNLMTRGVALTHLVGRTFQVGTVKFRGVRINEPCQYFENMLGKPGIETALLHRSGLNAEVLTDGVIRVGDDICDVREE